MARVSSVVDTNVSLQWISRRCSVVVLSLFCRLRCHGGLIKIQFFILDLHMNKSLITNLIALTAMALGWLLQLPWLWTMGLFAFSGAEYDF